MSPHSLRCLARTLTLMYFVRASASMSAVALKKSSRIPSSIRDLTPVILFTRALVRHSDVPELRRTAARLSQWSAGLPMSTPSEWNRQARPSSIGAA